MGCSEIWYLLEMSGQPLTPSVVLGDRKRGLRPDPHSRFCVHHSGIACSFVHQTSHRHHYLLTVASPVPREKLPGVWHPVLAAVA